MEIIPDTMRAAAIDRFGGPNVLTIHELPVPMPSSSEVLIALTAAGVGPWDAEIRSGQWEGSDPPRFPLVLGTDGAGTVVAVGSHIRRFRVGDLVYSYSWENPKGGFYAEFVAVPQERVAPVPKRLDLLHAGAIATTGLTAIQGIDDALRVQRGEALIIHGASGGVGSLAIQFAKLRRAGVLATASGPEGVEFVKHLRADMVVDGKRDDIVAAARQFAPEGIDAVLGLAGGEAMERCLDTLRPHGRVAYPNGIEPEPKRRRGLSMIPYDAVAGIHQYQKLNHAIEAAKFKIPIAAAHALADASKAHQQLEKGHVFGKIVLRIH
jgi:NADPH:quinone reductase-like Zn-dependent oxidoreductase